MQNEVSKCRSLRGGSKNDFIHKITIALKELRENSVGIRMFVKLEFIPKQRRKLARDECNQLCKIIANRSLRPISHDTRKKKMIGECWRLDNEKRIEPDASQRENVHRYPHSAFFILPR